MDNMLPKDLSISNLDQFNTMFDAVEKEMKQILLSEVVFVNNTDLQKSNSSYLDLTWITKDYIEVQVRNMSRSHVRNSLQWCLKHQIGPNSTKNGIHYSDWIMYFTIRLLDPELGE